MSFSVRRTEPVSYSYDFEPLGTQTVSYTRFGISLEEVDCERDRLSFVVTADGETGEYRFSLEHEEDGKPVLRFDAEHSSVTAVERVGDLLDMLCGSPDLDGWVIVYHLDRNEDDECDGCSGNCCEREPAEDDGLLWVESPFALVVTGKGWGPVEFALGNDDGSDADVSVESYTIGN